MASSPYQSTSSSALLFGDQIDRLHHALGDAECLELAPGPCTSWLRLGRRCWPRGVGRWPGYKLLLSLKKKVDEIGFSFPINATQPSKALVARGGEQGQRQLQDPGMGPHIPRIARAELTEVGRPTWARLEPPGCEPGTREAHEHQVLIATRGEQHLLARRPLHISAELFVRNRLRWRCVEPGSVFSRGRWQPPRERVIGGADWSSRLLLLSFQGFA